MLRAGKEGEDTQVHAGGERDTALGKGEEDEDQTGRDRYSSSHHGTGQRCNLYGKVINIEVDRLSSKIVVWLRETNGKPYTDFGKPIVEGQLGPSGV
jgi:hypothetical protein